MGRRVLTLALFLTFLGIILASPIVDIESPPRGLRGIPEPNSYTVSGIGDNAEDIVDQSSNLHPPSDRGSHSVFSYLQDYGANYDQMTEGNISYAGTNYEDFVDQASNLHAPTDIGAHSSFAEMQDFDGSYDTLTEADTNTGTSTFGRSSASGASYVSVSANYMYGGVYTASSTGEVASVVFYGRSSTGTINTKGIITNSSGYILPNGVSSAVGVSATAGDKTLTFAAGSRPIVVSGNTYWILIIPASNSMRLYYTSTTGASSKSDTTNSYASPTDPTDATNGTYTWRRLYANINNLNHELDLEVGWTSAQYSESNEALCIYGGIQNSETLNVDVWDGAAWVTVITGVQAGWNNVSVTSYLTTSSFEIRFVDSMQTDDAYQGSWQIEGILLHCWTPSSWSYGLDLEVGWTAADYDETYEYLCIYPVTGGGWPTEDIKIDVWSGTWINALADLTPDQWNNVSVSSYLTSSAFEVRFLGGTETGDTTQDTWEIDAVLLHTWTPSYTPLIDQIPYLNNPTDTDNMYAQYAEYQVSVYVSDQNGFADIDFLEIGLWDDTRATEFCRFRYDEDTSVFSEQFDGGNFVTLNTGSSSATKSGNDIDATFFFTIDWDFPDSTDIDARCYVEDAQNESTTTWYEVDWDIETRLEYSVLPHVSDSSGTPDRGNVDGSFSLTGTVIYYGSVNVAPSSTAVDIWVSASEYGTNVGPWSDLTPTSGAFNVTCYADNLVGLDTYTVKVVEEGAGAGGTDLFYTSSATDTYIADRLIITLTDPIDQRIDTGANATGIVASAIYDYDDTSFDGTLNLNDTVFNYGTVGIRGYEVSTASGGVHGVSLIGVNDETYCIWDSLTITITDPFDQRININTNASGIVVTAVYNYDSAPFDGTLALNNTQFSYPAAQIQWYTVLSASGGTYGITVISSNDVTYCIWDSLTISVSDPLDQRININANASGIVVSVVYDYDGSLFDGILTLNNTQFSYGTAQIQWYRVGSVSGGAFGITAISTNDMTYCIWDSLTIAVTEPSDQRININANASGVVVTAVYNYDSSPFDGTLTLNNTLFSYATAQIQWYTVMSASGGTYGITAISANDVTWCIWDSVTITITDPFDQRINVNTNASGIIVSAIYDYDGSAFDGILTLNNTQFTYMAAQIQYYTIPSISSGSYGISAISTNDMTFCIWDSLTVTITNPLDQRINIGANASGIVVGATYDYDSTPFDGTLGLNNTQFAYSTAQIQWYTALSASGGTYGITAISANDVTWCIWDAVSITITDPGDQRININANASGIVVSAVYDYDGSAFDGVLALNNTQFAYAAAQIQWYTVQGVSGGAYGITAISVNDATYCIWDSLTIIITDPADQRININTNASGIVVTAVYDYDGTTYDGALTINSTQFVYAVAQRQGYTVQSASGDTYGITLISSNDVTYCIWDSLTITITDPSDQRININTNASGIVISAIYDYDGSAFDGVLSLNNTQFSYATAQIQWYRVSSVSGGAFGITAVSIDEAAYCIWDSLTVVVTDPSDQRINVNTNASGIVVTAFYDYDGSAFDGTVGLNNTQFSYALAQIQWYTVQSVSGGAYGITAISANDMTWCIWDSLRIIMTDPIDQRININTNASGIIVSAVYEYDDSTFDGILTLNNTLFIYSSVQIQWYSVQSASGGVYGITTISSNDVSYCIWDSLTITITDPLDRRININTNASGIVVSAVHDYDSAPFDGMLILNNTQFVYATAQIQWYTVQGVSGGTYGITAISANDVTYCIWDSLTIAITDPTDQRINISSNASAVVVTVIYDYDGAAFDGTFTLNNTQFAYAIAQKQGYTVQSVSGGTHGITAISTNDVTYCIWDSLTIVLTAPLDQRINVNANATGIILTATYDYDGAAFDGTLTLNNTQFTYSISQRQAYTVQSVSGGTHGITAISTNDVTYCIWDSLTISITDPLDQRININTNASGIVITAVYDYDGAEFDGILTLNNTLFAYSTAQIQWYTVQGVSEGTYGITAVSANDVTYCIWDSLTVSLTDPSDQRININANATGIIVSAIYDYDGSVFDGVLTLNNSQFSYGTAQIQWYTLGSASGGAFGITAISNNDVTYCIWDSLRIVITEPLDQHIDINTNASGIIVAAVYNYDGSAFDGSLTLNNTQFTYSTAQIQWYTVLSASGGTHGITAISANDATYCIWDSLTITISDSTDQRINVNTNASGIVTSAVHDYDGSVFDGVLILNNTQFTYGTAQIQWYTVDSASGGTHGIRAISANDATYCIWDQLVITIGVDDSTPLNGVQANFSLTVIFDYDDAACTSYQIVVQRNSTWWHSFIGANVSLFVDVGYNISYSYTTRSISFESNYSITAFSTNAWLVTWSSEPNNPPMNDSAPTLTNGDDTDRLYARYRYYIIITSVSDPDGFADISYVELSLYSDDRVTLYWRVRYTYSTDTFSVEVGGAVVVIGSMSDAVGAGNTLSITWYLKIGWDHEHTADSDVEQSVFDGTDSDSDSYETNWDVETRLDYSVTPSLSDDHGDVNTTDLVVSGSITYYGSSLSPLANETDVWIIHDVAGSWNGDLAAGSFSISSIGSSASIRLNTYTIKTVAEGAGSGSTDLYFSTSPTDTFITDRIEIYLAGVVDLRININSYCEVWWRARYEYNGTEIQSGLLIQLNGSRTLIWNAGGSYWRWQETSSVPISAGFTVVSVVESIHGLTEWSDSTTDVQAIWDALIITMTNPTDMRVNVGANATGIYVSAIYAYDGATFDGALALNNTYFSYATPQIQGYTVLSAADDSFGITAILSNDVVYCIWDRVLVTSITADELYHDPGDNVRVIVGLQYEYDALSVTSGTFAIEGHALTHVGSGLWETYVTEATYQAVSFDLLTLCNAALYGITEFNMDSNEVTVYWDRIEFYSVSVDHSRLGMGDTALVQWSARLENAGVTVPNGVVAVMTGDITCIPSSGVYVASVTQSTVGSYSFSIISASLGEISSYVQSAADLVIIWDRVQVTSITATSFSQDVGVATEIRVTLVYEFDESPFTSGSVSLTGATNAMTYNSAGAYWSVSVTRNTAGNYTFSVESISDSLYGISALDSANLSVEIEWVAVPGFAPDTMTLLLIGGGVGVGLIGVALIASRRRHGAVSAGITDIEPSDFGIYDETATAPADSHIEETSTEPAEPEPDTYPPAELPVSEVHEPLEVPRAAEAPTIEEIETTSTSADELHVAEEVQPTEPVRKEPLLAEDVEMETIEALTAPATTTLPESMPAIEVEKPLTKQEILDRLPPEIRDAIAKEDLEKMSRKEAQSLLDSYTPSKELLPEPITRSAEAGVSDVPLGIKELSKLDKKTLVELLPSDFKATVSPDELKRLSKKELISLLESFMEPE